MPPLSLQRLRAEAAQAQARAEQAKLKYNPLNHPLLKGFTQR